MYEIPDLITHLFEGVYVVDKNRKIVFWNSGSERITGYTAQEVVNKNCYSNILRHITSDGKELCFGGCPLHATLQDGEIRENEVFLHHKDGHRVPVLVKTLPLYDGDGNITSAIEVFTDLRFRQETYKENRELKELLTNDPLTNIPNRRYLDFYLKNLVLENQEFNTDFGILFFDIDDFKFVNDTYGHNVGDLVLQTIAKTLSSNVRSKETVGRWGGEEFIGIIRVSNEKELMVVAEKLRYLIQKSTVHLDDGTQIKVTVSIGGTLFIPSEEVTETIDRADKNMYESKKTGKNKSTIK